MWKQLIIRIGPYLHVMLVQAKCVQYWPEERHSHSIVYEDLQIHLRRRIITKNYTTTTLLLQHQDVCSKISNSQFNNLAIHNCFQKMVCREVTHFWFTGWPDHGVPSSTHSLVEFLLHVQKHTISDMPGPTVVHCRYAQSTRFKSCKVCIMLSAVLG